MKKSVFVVSELYYPEDTSTGYFMKGIAEGLAQSQSVQVLCSQPTYSARGLRAPHREIHNSVRILRCWSTTLKKDILPFRILNLLTFSLTAFLAALRRVRAGDYVLVVTNPPLLPFMMAAVTRFRRANLLLLIHDVYPEVLVATGILRQRMLLTYVINLLVRSLFRFSKRIIVLGRDMQILVQSKFENGDPPVVIIPNWADISVILPQKRSVNTLLRAQGLESKFVVQYSGNIGRTHGLEVILECARSLKDHSKIHFLFIGRGGKKYILERTVQKQQLTNVTVLDYVPRDQLAISLNACDIAIISLIPGKPIIAVADSESELARVIREEEIGWVIYPEDTDGLRMAILEARTDPVRLAQMGLRARCAAETKYSFERVSKAYKDMISTLLDEVA